MENSPKTNHFHSGPFWTTLKSNNTDVNSNSPNDYGLLSVIQEYFKEQWYHTKEIKCIGYLKIPHLLFNSTLHNLKIRKPYNGKGIK